MTSISLWIANDPLILASKSAIRKTLLNDAGLYPDILVPDFDERQFERDHAIKQADRAQRLADEKALIISRQYPKAWVIGADQTLECDGEIFTKPKDRDNAAQQLLRLQGRTHILKSGMSIARGGEIIFHVAPEARLTMRALTAEAVEFYLDLAGPDCLHSVGAYQIEALGQHLFEYVEGRHSVILGLPVQDLLGFLRSQSCLAF
jgi:septum formation protein